ncbi:MAG: hypothetical protein LBU16_01010 [Treponema sp.]|nr:hypothetical protein [Treponema sp.]
MKKSFFSRIIGLAAVYAGIFVVLVVIQFSNRRTFTRKVGDFVVSGSFGFPASGAPRDNEQLLAGEASILYGGMEFFLTDNDGDGSLSLLTFSGEREYAWPVAMTVTDNAALFRLSGGAAISFANRHNGGTQELRISIEAPDYQALELPYRLLRSSRIRRGADGESLVIAGGKSYRFNASTVDFERRLIIIDMSEPTASYGTVPGTEVLDPSSLILAAARDKRQYDEALDRWLDRSFALWSPAAGANPDEETALAYLAESARRGVYRSAVAGISLPEGPQRSFRSSVYLGRMDQGLRSSIAYERDNFSRLSRLIADGSADFLQDFHVIEFLALRGHDNLIDSAAAIVNSLADADLSLVPGILEGYVDWPAWRPDTDNPFARLMDQACLSLSERIVARGERIVVFDGDAADMEFNIRLGAALAAYGEQSGQELWAGLGCSLVLSVLALADETGNAPLVLRLGANGEAEADGGPGSALGSARIYRLLRLGDYTARAVGLNAAGNGVWTWTAASEASANFDRENNMLDISAAFPRGETHYMFIRGIRPFAQIRLYNIPFRTDPRFETYDSSGWAYSPSEQTLMVKMKHQLPTEHIQIYYTNPAINDDITNDIANDITNE